MNRYLTGYIHESETYKPRIIHPNAHLPDGAKEVDDYHETKQEFKKLETNEYSKSNF